MPNKLDDYEPGTVYSKPTKRLASTMAMLSILSGGNLDLGFKSKSDYPKTKTEKLLDECHSIKGLSAKEMGTSGKKKLSRAKRKNKKR